MNAVKTYENENLKLEIVYDPDPESPREWDNLGTMVCWHSKYALGDKQPKMDLRDWSHRLVNMDDDTEPSVVWEEIHKQFIILPLYLYDHGGITMRTSKFSCGWDSGQVGWIYCEKGKEGMTDEQLTNYLEGEVETYDTFLRGEIYGFRAYKLVTCKECGHIEEEEVDLCWGFYGSDHVKSGLIEYLPDEFKALLD